MLLFSFLSLSLLFCFFVLLASNFKFAKPFHSINYPTLPALTLSISQAKTLSYLNEELIN